MKIKNPSCRMRNRRRPTTLISMREGQGLEGSTAAARGDRHNCTTILCQTRNNSRTQSIRRKLCSTLPPTFIRCECTPIYLIVIVRLFWNSGPSLIFEPISSTWYLRSRKYCCEKKFRNISSEKFRQLQQKLFVGRKCPILRTDEILRSR